MLKSQLDPSPQNYETTSMFVENIFDTVKKAKAAKAAKSLAESKLMTPYQYPFDDPPSVKKKRPRKNAKKNGKVKKTSTPKKKPTTPRKARNLKDEAEKRKKATPVKSPRKYTKRVAKVPAPTDIDDEEAAFILSSISQRSFDSFYNRLNSCGSSKIHIPLDLPSLSVQNHSTESVKNQAYYVMLDHNYWIVEPPVTETPAKPEVTAEEIKTEIVQHHPNASATETQPRNGIIHVEPVAKLETVKQEEPKLIVNEIISTGISNSSNEDVKMNEVNNNKVLKTTETIPEKENSETILGNNTSVKKRWLRQAASEIKSPPKKRKNVDVVQLESKRKVEELLSEINCVNKTEDIIKEVNDQSHVVKNHVAANGVEDAKKEVKMVEDQVKTQVQAQKEEVQLQDEKQLERDAQDKKQKEEVEIKLESLMKEPESPLPAEDIKPEDVTALKEVPFSTVPSHAHEEVKKEQPEEITPVVEAQPVLSLPATSEPIALSPVKAEVVEPCVKDEKNYDSDECDKRSWEIVMDFHRLQLMKLTKANNRFSEIQPSSEPKRESSFDQKFRSFDSLHNHFGQEANVHFNKTRSPFTESPSPFNLHRNPDFNRKTSLTIDTNQYSLGPPAFQRSVSDFSLLDTRRSRWRGPETAPPSFYSNSIPSFTSLGSENLYKHEPYSKTNYSTYRAQKALSINSQTPDAVDALWELPFEANKTKSESFLGSYHNDDNTSVENAFKRAAVDSNIPRKNLTAIAMTKTRTAVSDPRLNPSLQHEAKKEESSTPKKKVKALSTLRNA